MKNLVYVSGPPCSGKTALCAGLLREFPGVSHVSGDRFWADSDKYGFEERVSIVNGMILDEVRSDESDSILVEWVPNSGAFCAGLRDICDTSGRSFFQIALFAELTVLRHRKMLRDGDADVSPSDVSLPRTSQGVLVLDTGSLSADAVIRRCIRELVERGFFMPAGSEENL